ncbi:MAG: molybdopterin-dependent oxidoreductase [Acidobacteria bacterium]|nr:molybdopterin-dependent oxidoreductase [Acidobacteriota bacterium]
MNTGEDHPSRGSTESRGAAEPRAEVERIIRSRTRRSFLVAGVVAAAGVAGWRWLVTRREDQGIPWPLRRVLETNEQWARDYFDASRLAPTFPVALAAEPRPNGGIGLEDELDSGTWRLQVTGLAESPDPLSFSIDEIRSLPRFEMTTELQCIEGWSQIVHWAGVRFQDLAIRCGPATVSGEPPDVRARPDDLVPYASVETPDGEYYVGLDMTSALHPQTMLCYEMNGQPLSSIHGAPLRLVIPVKYGIKSIKRIGTIRFTHHRPLDYWAERGYDWYAGL